jgi:ABC-type nitrate/sulfonate/bicarbonate transport system substrate-binding protein
VPIVRRSALLVAVLFFVLVPPRAGGQSVETVEVIVFPGGFNWPLWAAQERGLFTREGLEVKLTPTPSSLVQLTSLIEGKADIAMTAFDNVVAYQEGQGEAPVRGTPDLFAFMGGDDGFLRLVVQPAIARYADLGGKELSVDALTTGYAFVLRKMLERGGLAADAYSLVRAGGVLQRFEALKARKHAGTLLVSPFEILAEAAGLRRLGDAIDVLGHYQGLVGATRQEWAEDHHDELVGFIRAYRGGLAWLYEAANKADALRILQKNVPGMSGELAAKTYDVLLAPRGGFARDAAIDMEGVRTVLALRSEYGEPRRVLTRPARYVNLRYYEHAARPR